MNHIINNKNNNNTNNNINNNIVIAKSWGPVFKKMQ